MTVRRLIIALTVLVASGAPLSAQFVTFGDDPGRLRWRQIRTDAFRVIYPEGTDSLARTYTGLLERYRPVVGESAGMMPGQYQKGPIPVILHPYYPYANGSVMWAPRRMDLYTVQEPYAPEPMPWPLMLSVHESRHVAQMQFGYRKPLVFGTYLTGEMWQGLLTGLFVETSLLEGDAVVTETALTTSGRVRTADFLNYYQLAFDEGDWRDWYQWRYGSFKRAAPDYYTTGFMTVAGMRVFYDQPAFSKDFYTGIVRKPLPYHTMQRAVSRGSGEKFPETWRRIQEGFHTIWSGEADARSPFLPAEALTPDPEFETNYSGLTVLDGAIYAFKSGKTLAKRLVRLEDGGADPIAETDCGRFGHKTGGLIADPVRHRLYWSETVDDVRWGLAGTSRIRCQDADGRRRDLTAESRYFNPAPSPDGTKVAAVEYPYEGGTPAVVLDADSGAVIMRIPPPSGVQFTEVAWLEDRLYALGINEEGFGLWGYVDSGWEPCLKPTIQKMQQLRSADGRLTYVSDRNGVNEWYSYEPLSGRAEQLTNSRYGGKDYVTCGESVYYTAPGRNGRKVFRLDRKDLSPTGVDPLQVHTWTVAEALVEQERTMLPPSDESAETIEIPDPRPYRKGLNLLHFHSWLPLYFNYDAVESMSFDLSYDTASPGATGFFQNDLGTATGFVGYSAHPDPYQDGHWRHSLHGKFSYSGLYPVLEASWDLNDRAAIRDIRRTDLAAGETKTIGYLSQTLPVLSGSLRAYVPLKFNKDGLYRGVIPQVKWTFGNDAYSTEEVMIDSGMPFGKARPASFEGATPGENVPFQAIQASLRGYVTLPTASSQVYPRLGIGAEAGYQIRPGLSRLFSPSAYGYLYGYLPGFRAEQGLRLTAIGRYLFDKTAGIPYLSVVTYPRGYTSVAASKVFGNAPIQAKTSIDYAIPLYFGDISLLSPFVYIRNFLLIPHADLAYFGGRTPDASTPSPDRSCGTLFSAGLDLTVETGNVLWIPFAGSFGVTFNILGGNTFPDTGAKRCYVGALFSVDI